VACFGFGFGGFLFVEKKGGKGWPVAGVTLIFGVLVT
jgi:hypothetical protein